MNKFFIIIFFFTLANLHSQNSIYGEVKDTKGMPLEGVNIYLNGTVEGSTSNSDGMFFFKTNKIGNVTLIASFIGYKDFLKTVNVNDLKNIKIVLYEDDTNLDEIIISASSFSIGKSRTLEKMNSLDIVMTGSSNGDIFAALQSLPGTQKVGEDGRLYIRGGEDRETQTFIDGMHVLVPYTSPAQNISARSRFSPFLFKGINFSLGGYELEYGQALSSVLPMETKDVSSGTKLGVNFSPLSIGAGGTYSFGKESISANLDYTNLGFYNSIFPDRFDWKKDYSKLSGELQYKKEIGKSGLFKIYTGYDKTGFVQNISDELNNLPERSFDLKQNNYYINSTYSTKTKSGFNLFFGSAFSQVKNDYKNATIQGDLYEEDLQELHLKSKLKKSFSSKYKINTGVEAYLKKYENRYTDTSNIIRQNQNVDQNIYAAFLDNQFKLTKGVYANASGRVEYSTYNDEFAFSPRASINYINGDFQLSGVFGKYYQTPGNIIIASNQIKLKQESASHYILGSSYNFNNRLLRLELYYKNYKNLSLLENDIYTSNGFGKSNGLDIYFADDKTFKKLEYTFSFSYNDSKRLYKDYPVKSTPLFSTDINTSLNVKYLISPIKTYLGISNTYASGRPYNNPNESGFVNSKAKSFHSLDMNLTFLLSEKIILYTSLTNVLGRENIFGYNYSDSPNISGAYKSSPINVSRDRFFFVGLFISLKNNAAYDVSSF
jgi:hypothetical protein